MATTITLTINPAIDVSTTVSRFVPFSKLRGTPPHREPGGGGINAARVIKRLGGDVTAVYPAGGAIGMLLQRLVEREGVPSCAINTEAETRENFTVVDTSSGRQFRFVMPGVTLRENEWRACLDAVSGFKGRVKFILASGSLPQGVPRDFYAEVARLARRIDARLILDTSDVSLRAGLDEGVFLIKPNLREFQELTGAAMDSEAEWIEAGRELIANGRVELIALSLGEQGAILMARDQAWVAKGLPVKSASVVGAGDSFLAGMVWSLASNGSDLTEALKYGMAAGAAATLNPGTALSRRKDVMRLHDQVRIEHRRRKPQIVMEKAPP